MHLRTDPHRVAVFALGLAFVLILGAYGFAAIESRPTLGGMVSALAALAIAGSGLLYAWRLGNGGIVD
jgi:acyl-CoA synthetase (NDP forming)